MARPLEGKVALVTGGSRGIGLAIVRQLASQGAHIALNYVRNHKAAEIAEEELRGRMVRCLLVRAHLGEPEQIRRMIQEVEREFGRIDILVNNAASGVQRPAMELEEKHWDWTMNVNARGPWICVKEAARLMPNGGKVVNISSLGSQRVLPYYLSVGVSKAALEAVTRYLAVELAPRGINVNAVAGGLVETEALQHFPNREAMLAQAKNKTPGNRLVSADDIARAVFFLCSEEASMIRGQVIVVDGGMSLIG